MQCKEAARYQKRRGFFDVVEAEINIATRLQPDRKLQFENAGEMQISWDINSAVVLQVSEMHMSAELDVYVARLCGTRFCALRM